MNLCILIIVSNFDLSLDVNGIPAMPKYDREVDWQFQYHRLFMDNELKLQQYDQLLKDREKDLKLF